MMKKNHNKPKEIMETTKKVYYIHTNYLFVGEDIRRFMEKIYTRVTIALSIDGNKIRYGLAMCSHKDNFCKRIGRKLAELRMDLGYRVFEWNNPNNKLKLDKKNTTIEVSIENERDFAIALLRRLAKSISENPKKFKRKLSEFNNNKED